MVKKLNSIPRGFRKNKGGLTAPRGYAWYNNGKSRFKPGYKSVLVRVKKDLEIRHFIVKTKRGTKGSIFAPSVKIARQMAKKHDLIYIRESKK